MGPLASLASSGGGTPKLYVDDVFSADVYIGNASTQNIVNGIDLAGKGGMVWASARSSAFGHYLFDSVRGLPNRLSTHNTNAQSAVTPAFISAFNSNGFSVQSDTASTGLNTNNLSGVALTFRKAPKFFDIVPYTGNGSANRQIPHALGIDPGMVAVKALSSANVNDWITVHRAQTNKGWLRLNTTAATADTGTDIITFDSTQFTVQPGGVSSDYGNQNGIQYVAYILAHDTSIDGLIQCGTFTTDGSGNVVVPIGFEPQMFMYKPVSTTGNWWMADTSRGLYEKTTASNLLRANTSDAEATGATAFGPTATGMFGAAGVGNSVTCVYVAIRRSNKPPTSGTQIYNAIPHTGTSSAATINGVGFVPDLVMTHSRNAGSGIFHGFWDRLRGSSKLLLPWLTDAEYSPNNAAGSMAAFNMDGYSIVSGANDWGLNVSATTYIMHFLKRAPGVFDEVCFATDASGLYTGAHNLTVVPELAIFKSRTNTAQWNTVSPQLTSDHYYVRLNTTAAESDIGNQTYTASATGFVIPNTGFLSASQNYVGYFFASLPGISKIGKYTGNGGSAGGNGSGQTINCGFTAGARLVWVKCISHAGNWILVDTVRGIVSGNDPTLAMNGTGTELTGYDVFDPDSTGFVVNQVASGSNSDDLNVTGRVYIFLAIA